MRPTIPLALLLVCGTAQAETWVPIRLAYTLDSHDHKDSWQSINIESVRITGDVRRAWIKTTFAPQTKKGFPPRTRVWVDYVLTLTEFNCREQATRHMAITVYYIDGELTSASDRDPEWDPAPPGTMQSYTTAFVCSWKPK